MDNSRGQKSLFDNRERGSASLKFILIIVIIAAVAYIGVQYVPVAYQGERFKGAIDKAVNDSDTLGLATELMRGKIMAAAKEWDIPPDVEITPERTPDGHYKARVQYKRPVVFFGYKHIYSFDYTATSTGFGIGGK